jgi:GYF domain 2
MQEYYIRQEGDEDSRGPFTLDQLASLVEAGQVNRQTYYYDSISEKWLEIQSSAELVATLFPTKKKLSFKPKESTQNINTPKSENEKPITVEEMLAAAEGETAETRGKRDLTPRRAMAARWGMRAMALMFIISACGMLVLHMDAVLSLDVVAIVSSPFILIGIADLILGLLLFLEITALYSLVRFRAALGLGFLGFLFWADGNLLPIAALAAGSIGAFLTTLTVNLWSVCFFSILGLAGMVGVAYFLVN